MSPVNTGQLLATNSVSNQKANKFDATADITFKYDFGKEKVNFIYDQFSKAESKLLIICGPTATGKTGFGIEMANKFGGEIISADSRQVYKGMDVVTGKDLPKNDKRQVTNVKWRDRHLSFYEIEGVRVWLYDVVEPNEPFNVAFWKECFDLISADMQSRSKLPIVVGGTGLYFKSLRKAIDVAMRSDEPK